MIPPHIVQCTRGRLAKKAGYCIGCLEASLWLYPDKWILLELLDANLLWECLCEFLQPLITYWWKQTSHYMLLTHLHELWHFCCQGLSITRDHGHLIHLGTRLSAIMYPLFERMIRTFSGKESEGLQDGLWGLQHCEAGGADNFEIHSAPSGPAQIKDRRTCTTSKF